MWTCQCGFAVRLLGGDTPVSVETIATARPRPAQSGFSLLEVLIGAVVLAVALLGHLASTGTEHRLAEQQRVRSQMLQTTRQFMERLRSDENWDTLYDRLRTAQFSLTVDGKAGTALDSGKLAWQLTDYYPEIVVPETLSDMRVRVEVPATPTMVSGALGMRLREDASLEQFGLPADLDGTGTITSDVCDDSYVALPVVVTFRWELRGQAAREMRVATWLRGNR